MAMYIREVSCDICETVDDVNNFCFNCKQKFCDNCKKGHLRTASTKHHTFAPIGDSLLPRSQQNDICDKHQQEKLFYCKTCGEVACSFCLEEFHQNHTFSVITRLADATREEIIEKLTAKEKELQNARSSLHQYTTAVERCRKQSIDTKAYIKKTIKGWVDDLKSLESELIETTETAAERETNTIKKAADDMENKLSLAKASKRIQDIKLKMRTCSDISLLEQKTNIMSSLKSIAIPMPAKLDPVMPITKLNTSSKEKVRQMLQNESALIISSCEKEMDHEKHRAFPSAGSPRSQQLRGDLKVITMFRIGDSVFDIAPVSESKAWICTTRDVMLVNTDGKILLQHPHNNTYAGTSVTSTSSGDALYVHNSTVINRIDQTCNVSKFADFKNTPIYHVRSSRLTTDVYVATNENILILSSKGNTKKRIDCGALAVTELSDGRLVAITSHSAEMVLLDRNGSATRLGISINWKCGIFTTGLASDSCDRIVIGKAGIHLYKIEEDRMMVTKAEYKLEHDVYGFASDTHGNLWIAHGFPGVTIAQYAD